MDITDIIYKSTIVFFFFKILECSSPKAQKFLSGRLPYSKDVKICYKFILKNENLYTQLF